MALVEGIGDEVLVFAAILVLIAVIFFAWASTSVRPLFNNGSVWMVHMQTAPERRVLEVYSLDESATASRQVTSSRPTISETSVADTSDSQNSTNAMETSLTNTNTRTNVMEESDDGSDQSQAVNSDHSIGEGEETSESPRRRIVVTATTDGESGGPESNVEIVEGTADMQPTSSADTTTIKLKFLDDTQKLVATWLSQTVGEFKRQHFETDVSQGKVVRLIYRGQLLRDDSRSLASYGLHDNCVLHCHVSTTPYEQQSARRTGRTADGARSASNTTGNGQANNGTGNGLDLGRYIYVIFAFNFAALWSAWFVFPEYFSRTSLVSLILCSGLFMLFWYGSQRRRPTAPVAGNASS